jgi:protein-disulfide isomerase
MYSDFQCPFCRTFARDVLPALERKYVDAGRLLLAFRHLPSRQLHPQAIAAAQLAECARRLDRFWPVHDQIFSLPREFDETALRAVARKAGVDPDVTEACRADQLSKAVTSDLDTARTLGIRGTPTVMIGLLEDNLKVRVTRLFVGARPVEEFDQAIDAVLLQSSKAN